MSNVDDFFDNVSGGDRSPSFKFGEIGSGIRGTVVDQYRTVVTDPQTGKPKLDRNGNEQPQLNVTLQTELRNWEKVAKIPTDKDGKQLAAADDNGKRRIFVKYQMIRAVKDALDAAGVRALATGGTLAVKKSGEMNVGQLNPLPEYEARYTPPAENEDLFEESKKESESTPSSADDEPPF